MVSLSNMCREKYWEYEYDEVVTPNIFNFDLWVSHQSAVSAGSKHVVRNKHTAMCPRP
jgi:hypothetical protein